MDIPRKNKKCKGTGKAKEFGCGEIKIIRRYGLCSKCLYNFIYHSAQGAGISKKTLSSAKKKVKKTVKRKYVKWVEKQTNEMIQYLQGMIVNPYIRLRDIEKYSIYDSISGGGKISDAGHFFNIKNNQRLRFCIQNIHGQSSSHNRDIADPGHINEYRQGLINRFGQKYVTELEKLKKESANWPKLDRDELIEIGKTYEMLTKKKIWCFRHEEFENYRNMINK